MESRDSLIDYFAVCGLNVDYGLEPDQHSGDNLDSSPLERPFKSRVLTHLPHNVPSYPFDSEAVSMLCFPRGLRFRTDKEERKHFTHTFVITREDGTRSYGSVLTFYEEVTSCEIMLAMQTLQDMHTTEMSNTQSLTLKRHRERRRTDEIHNRSRSSTLHRTSHHYHESTSNTTHKRPQLEYKRLRDVLYCTKSICFLSRIPVINAHLKLLNSLYEAMVEGGTKSHHHHHHSHHNTNELSVASYLFNYLYNIPPLHLGSSIKIYTYKSSICCQRPDVTDLPLFDYPFRELFSIFQIREIMPIFTSILLEHQVLIFSKDPSKLMLVAECISCLLFPFQWPHTYVPILPSSLVHFLDAPVPFIMGLCVSENSDENDADELFKSFSQSNSCVVDIDRRRVGAPEDLPAFPHSSMLQQDLEHEIKRFKYLEKSLSQNKDSSHTKSDYDGNIKARNTHKKSTAYSSSSSSLNTNIDWSVNAKLEMLQKNEALARLRALAEKSGVRSDISDFKDSLTDAAISKHKAIMGKTSSHLDEHTRDLLFNSSIREVFLQYFLQLFSSYESFVIHQTGDSVQQWLNNRETSQNFDKTAFLSDQSDETIPFLAPFIETQMFASFIDQKILLMLQSNQDSCYDMTQLSASTASDHSTEHCKNIEGLKVFSNRLKQLQKELQQAPDHRERRFYRSSVSKIAASIEKKATIVDHCSPQPHAITTNVTHVKGFFPHFTQDSFQQALKDRRNKLPEWKQIYGSKRKGTFKKRDEYLEQTTSATTTSDTNIKVMVNNSWIFTETLLKEVKNKTKRMLVQKMGKEAVELGHGEVTRVGIEENTLIASLCDLLERIWSYGLLKKQDKSSLWQHLNNFYEASNDHSNKENASHTTPANNNKNGNEELTTTTTSTTTATTTTTNEGHLTWPIRQHRRSNSRGLELPTLDPLPSSVLWDFKNVMEMTEIKTSIGLARAFVRLSLEKKLLSKHLKELFSNQELLRKLYKRNAFLRCEDEREQFLCHLLSLNAVDYHCFTNTFFTSMITYRVLIYPRMKMGGGTTSANCWIRLSGQLGNTEEIPLPKHSLDVTFKHKNLGMLTSMRIGHDNSGLSSKWMVENVVVRNQVTGHTYRFTCGRWLGKGIDDGALERLLVAELLPASVDSNELMERCKTPPRCRSPSTSGKHYEAKASAHEIRERLGDSVNNLVKHYCSTDKEARESSTKLLCGEGGLVSSLELIFQYGFKSSRFLRNRFFIWDFLEKVVSCYESILSTKDCYISDEIRTTMQSFCYVIGQINNKSQAIGKDERFQIFVCFGLRDRLLLRWLRLVSKSPVTVSMFEDFSFLRDSRKLKVVLDLLDSLKDYKVVLEASVLRGIEL